MSGPLNDPTQNNPSQRESQNYRRSNGLQPRRPNPGNATNSSVSANMPGRPAVVRQILPLPEGFSSSFFPYIPSTNLRCPILSIENQAPNNGNVPPPTSPTTTPRCNS